MISIDTYIFSSPSETQNISINFSIVPIVQIIAAPTGIVNDRNVYLIATVKDSETGTILPTATLFYKFDSATVSTSLGINRNLALSELSDGAHLVEFIANIGSVYSMPVRVEWIVDTVVPITVDITPSNRSDTISLKTPIIITFSKPMNANTVMSGIVFTPNIVGSWSNLNLVTFIYTPSVDMLIAQTYTIQISENICDIIDNKLSETTTSVFTTIPIINYAPESPTFTNVMNPTAMSSTQPRIIFNVPNDLDNDNLHFNIDFAIDASFTRGYKTFDSMTHADSFTYYNQDGLKISPFPVNGISPNSGKVVFKSPESFGNGEYWYKVFSNDRT